MLQVYELPSIVEDQDLAQGLTPAVADSPEFVQAYALGILSNRGYDLFTTPSEHVFVAQSRAGAIYAIVIADQGLFLGHLASASGPVRIDAAEAKEILRHFQGCYGRSLINIGEIAKGVLVSAETKFQIAMVTRQRLIIAGGDFSVLPDDAFTRLYLDLLTPMTA